MTLRAQLLPPNNQSGFGLVEIVVAVTIITIVSIFISLTITQVIQARTVMLQDTHKLYLAEEGYEMVRFLRDDSWSAISSLSYDQAYYFDSSTTTIALSVDPEVIGQYTRSFRLLPVYRSGAGEIVDGGEIGATIDEGSRFVRVHVVDDNGTTTVEAIMANIFTP